MSDEVKPGTPASAKKDAKPGKEDAKGKKGGFFEKYKMWIILGGLIVLILVFYLARKNSASSTTATDPTTAGIDPTTGLPYGTQPPVATAGGSPTDGAPGQTGQTGATGPKGPAGKTEDLWQIATQILHARGIKNPNNNQIWHVRQNLEQTGMQHKPVPKHNPPKPKKPVRK